MTKIGATAVLAGVLGATTACSGGSDEAQSAPRDAAAQSEGQPEGTVIMPGEPGDPASTGPAPDAPEAPEFNHSDIAFVQMMVPHHAQALEMAKLAARHATGDDVRRLAARIRAAQAPEILTMASWLEAQGVEVPKAGDDPHEFDHGNHGHDPMMGMLSEAQMERLADARGAAFDRLFLRGMIQHHEGALDMASTVARTGADVLVAELAADVSATQTAEISRMEQLLRS